MSALPQVRIFLTALALLCFGCASADPAGSDAQTLDRDFARSTLQIAGADAKLHAFRVWVADNDTRRARGLMYVKQMDADAGMLFIYPRAQQISMWMKNTVLPLDMLFVAADGRVIKVAANATPQSLETIESEGLALGVVELNAGIAAKLNIRAGSQIIHPAFLKR
ncbi:MAG TPA: DUF192 domain-containing protein [Povalibacter sp.]|uniref:DUF192 domain-containing protein n=1 Tax=Povalibacter sp. TaxID=1962978 RepID=UPI002C48A176|nr:DUF192 domain-containing protein [Povalibacter sp.]HMN45542.1 DUF192 domain-containing protein [Povalibacter sp.]